MVVVPAEYRWTNKVTHFTDQQQYSKHVTQAPSVSSSYCEPTWNSYAKWILVCHEKCRTTWYIYLGLLLTAMFSSTLAMSTYALVRVQKLRTIASKQVPLFCDGSQVSRSTYNALFLAIGITYGVDDVFTTNDISLVFGGNASHTLTVAEMPTHSYDQGSLVTGTVPAHTYGVNDLGHNHGGSTSSSSTSYLCYYGSAGGAYGSYTGASGYFQISSHTHTINTDMTDISFQTSESHSHTINGTTDSEELGQPFNTMPPYHTVHYIIRVHI
ncbi:unnamed protein product [Adineta ricciae]|uniref:Phage tail collar domain-containing protein n=1 Tax=Adineta ricciae TaxID=249248 RepID=A0A815RAR3_ADIRI|nr:unnamed protein product [Adineta ricciae]